MTNKPTITNQPDDGLSLVPLSHNVEATRFVGVGAFYHDATANKVEKKVDGFYFDPQVAWGAIDPPDVPVDPTGFTEIKWKGTFPAWDGSSAVKIITIRIGQSVKTGLYNVGYQLYMDGELIWDDPEGVDLHGAYWVDINAMGSLAANIADGLQHEFLLIEKEHNNVTAISTIMGLEELTRIKSDTCTVLGTIFDDAATRGGATIFDPAKPRNNPVTEDDFLRAFESPFHLPQLKTADMFGANGGIKGQIPRNLWWYCQNLESALYMFSNCPDITGQIYDQFLRWNPKITTFEGMFNNCTGIIDIGAATITATSIDIPTMLQTPLADTRGWYPIGALADQYGIVYPDGTNNWQYQSFIHDWASWNITSMQYFCNNCINLSWITNGNSPFFPGQFSHKDYQFVSCTNAAYAFTNMQNMVGAGADILHHLPNLDTTDVNAVKRMFYLNTNLTDYATLPPLTTAP